MDVYGKNVTNGNWTVEIPAKNVCPACSCVLYILTISASKTHAQKIRNAFKHQNMENIVKDVRRYLAGGSSTHLNLSNKLDRCPFPNGCYGLSNRCNPGNLCDACKSLRILSQEIF